MLRAHRGHIERTEEQIQAARAEADSSVRAAESSATEQVAAAQAAQQSAALDLERFRETAEQQQDASRQMIGELRDEAEQAAAAGTIQRMHRRQRQRTESKELVRACSERTSQSEREKEELAAAAAKASQDAEAASRSMQLLAVSHEEAQARWESLERESAEQAASELAQVRGACSSELEAAKSAAEEEARQALERAAAEAREEIEKVVEEQGAAARIQSQFRRKQSRRSMSQMISAQRAHVTSAREQGAAASQS